jgi:hypothetical protein
MEYERRDVQAKMGEGVGKRGDGKSLVQNPMQKPVFGRRWPGDKAAVAPPEPFRGDGE